MQPTTPTKREKLLTSNEALLMACLLSTMQTDGKPIGKIDWDSIFPVIQTLEKSSTGIRGVQQRFDKLRDRYKQDIGATGGEVGAGRKAEVVGGGGGLKRARNPKKEVGGQGVKKEVVDEKPGKKLRANKAAVKQEEEDDDEFCV